VVRTVWNLGFCVKPELLQGDCALVYREVMARLFEAMVLIPLRFDGRVENFCCPGEAERFSVVANSELTPLMIDRNLPGDGVHVWELPKPVGPQAYSLRFIAFFDWVEVEHRDLRLLKVEIERMDERPELVGRHALIEFTDCTVWVEGEPEVDDQFPAIPAGEHADLGAPR
jgi:hypothetical protein